jgi:hypothetical protein
LPARSLLQQEQDSVITFSLWAPVSDAALLLGVRPATLRRHLRGLPESIVRRDAGGLSVHLARYVRELRRGLPQRPPARPRGWTVIVERTRPDRLILTLSHAGTEIRGVEVERAGDGRLSVTPPCVFTAKHGWLPVVTLAPAAVAAAEAAGARLLRQEPPPEPEAAAAA